VTELADTAAGLFGPRIPAHLYLHVPFCASKCDYCDFASVAGADDDFVEVVFAGIRTQITTWERAGLDGVVETVYFGGGTPSLHPGQVLRTLAHIRDVLVVHPNAEITVEANPDSLSSGVAVAFAERGVTRVSVGVQSFDDHVLRVLGRRHDAASATRACHAVLEAGLELSVDLMCGVPGQTITSWSETLARAAATGAHHASVYPLSIEDATPMAVAITAGLLAEPDSDVAAEMMVLAEATLGYHGLARYEVANYAESREHESRHNTAYWTGRPYAGVGPGAHGMLDAATARAVGLLPDAEATVARVRYGNAGSIEDWLVGRGDSVETLTRAETRREDVMLGMRLTRGVRTQDVTEAGLDAVMASLQKDGLVERSDLPGDGARWKTTRRGWLLGNRVFGRIWAGV
jgi:putative oxygen-independent coproporphyrinogen III oxidase